MPIGWLVYIDISVNKTLYFPTLSISNVKWLSMYYFDYYVTLTTSLWINKSTWIV
jgi:hypothetical protein